MQRLRSRLPPVNALVAFEASARHLSFTNAAKELGVTREAVSRQIRILESHLNLKLFLRHHRSLELSKAGSKFAMTVHTSLEEIAHAASSLGQTIRSPRIVVSATVAIASFWLTPRLPRFRRAHPDVEIRVMVSDQPVDFETEGVDIGLRYGDGGWPGLDALHLFEVESFPVCSPKYLRTSPQLEQPLDLLGHALLNLDGSVHETEDWAWWLDGLGSESVNTSSLDIIGFDNYANVMQAAIDGQGVALGFSGIVDELLENAQLVRPIPLTRRPRHGVYLVTPRVGKRTNSASHFYAWVLREAQPPS